MPPKQKKKNRSKRSGQGSGVGEDGGAGSGVGGSGGAGAGLDLMMEDMDIIDIDPFHPAKTTHVEVVYSEEQLTRYEDVPIHGAIREGWLQRCSRDSLQDWGHDLPGVDAGELVGRVVPETARSYSDLAPGKGLVLVELKDKNKGFVGQLRASRSSVMELQDTQAEFRASLRESREDTRRLVMDSQREMREEFRRIEEIHAAERTQMQLERTQMQLEIEDLREQIVHLKVQLSSMSAFMRKGVELSNKVKKRVALTLARNAMEIALGRERRPTETWSSYFDQVSADDWHRVGVERVLVRRLLADGAHVFNDSIHEIPAEEVVGSICSMPLGSLRSAWEEIFHLAFQRRVSDEVFREEVDYAAQQSILLDF